MLTRIVRGSLMRRRRRKVLSVLAVSLGIAVATAVGTVAIDVGDKVNHELRSFGANISVASASDSLAITIAGVDYRPPGTGSYLGESSLAELKKIFWRNNIMAFAPLLYAQGTVNGQTAVLAGSWFDKEIQINKKEIFRTGLKDMHPTWKIDGQWPSDGAGECLVGIRLSKRLGIIPGQEVTAKATGSGNASEKLMVRGVLETGGPEDDQLIVPLAKVQQWTHLEGKFRRAEVSALTKPEDAFGRADVSKMNQEEFERWNCSPYVRSIAYQIEQSIPGSVATPVYQVADTEGRILDRVGILMWVLAGAALITAGLAVTSMMLATVLERRAEIGLFKSLGATDARVATFFMLEACSIGVAGGLLGYFAGSLLAQRLSLDIFGLPASIHWIFLPAALALALVVTLVGSALPLGHDLKLSPAIVLRSE